MGGEGDVADGEDGRATPDRDRGLTPTPDQVAASEAAAAARRNGSSTTVTNGLGLPALPTSTSSTSGNVARTALVAASGGFGFTEPTSKMLAFVAMFEKNMGMPAFSPLLTAALLARGLGTTMQLSNLTMMKRLQTACVTDWSLTAGQMLAETAGDVILATREEFALEYGPGGLHHVPNLSGLSTGMGAGAGGGSSSSSSSSGGVPPGTLVMSPGLPLVGVTTSGEKYRNTMTTTRDRDGNMFLSHKGTDAPGYVVKWQHLLRALLKLRRNLVLGPDTDLTAQGYFEKLNRIYDMVGTMGRTVEDGWETVPGLRDIYLLRVFTDPGKFERFLEFKLRAKAPYLLSLNDFLPESSSLKLDRKESNTNDMTLLKVALDNLAQVFSVVLGEPVESYLLGLKPAFDMINSLFHKSIATSWTCYMISFGLEIVFLDFKEGVPLPTEPADKYTRPGAFSDALKVEMLVAAKCMPTGDVVSSKVQTFLDRTHAEIAWVDPGKAGSKEKTSSGSGSEGKVGSDERVQPLTKTQKRNERKRRRLEEEQTKGKGEHTSGSSSSGQGAGGGKGSSSGTRSRYEPAPLCVGHILGLLGVRNEKGYVIACDNTKRTGSSCDVGYHPPSLKMVSAGDAKDILKEKCWGSILDDALKAHSEVGKAKGFSK